ncbi:MULTISPECIES: thiol peroxidase [Prosthecochloris]|uniref:Thiol peroxidase n=1 Tax=Prosthecochloris marina TaxID=2017681 RepID=A0A317T8K3_9CHLB|nr:MULTISPECIES: thiol peroxidase [Prosthecochloris]PWW81761.1 lipid hydroperoxide peroxidase [Prosthecochloris marina]UZJ38457.1 thiol peroxidase [Prosthecochloris sp. SCSIO W1103]
MANITLKGNPVATVGELPAKGTAAPSFSLVNKDLTETSMTDFSGKRIVLNIFPSLDTPVCAASVRRFNLEASSIPDTVVLCVSADLPFAHKRFCEVEGIENVVSLSVFRSPEFGNDYGVTMIDGPLKGILSRAVVIVDDQGKVIYAEQVPEITQEPDYEAALKAMV